jgi:CO/xanthine dehydrogenase FAD-binding subunit
LSQLDYLAPTSADEAARALAAAGGAGRPLSGGTDLLVQLRSGRLKPGLIVDLKNIPGAIGVREQDGGFVIGASTPGVILAEHPTLSRVWPGVVEAANLIGSTQIQGRASMAGNLCNASPAADSVPALVAARATCVIVGPDGRRIAPAESIAIGPGRTSLQPGEFVLEIHLPPRLGRAADAYLRSIPRTEMDIAVVGAAVNLILDADGVIADARVALGAVGPTVILAEDAGAALVGSRADDVALARLDEAAQAVCRPITDKRGTADFRTKIAGVLARRVAAIAYGRAKEGL